jgi:hypothetical protein
MLIIPKTTGEPVAGLGEPRIDDDEPVLAAVVLELAADELVLDFDELPQATVPTAVRAHTPTRAARLLTYDVISLLSSLEPLGSWCAVSYRRAIASRQRSLRSLRECMQVLV